MKKLILAVNFIITAVFQKTSAQETPEQLLQPIIYYYLDVKNALIQSNGDSVGISARNLYKVVNETKTESFPASQHKAIINYTEKLSYDAEHMKQTVDIEHQREHFMKLSDNMYKMIKEFGIDSLELFYQFCPMANDGKGAYWISEEQKISNPYYGKKMLRCGSTKETLKVNR